MKIIDRLQEKINKKETFYSFEFFPPKTEAGVYNLFARLDRMASLDPAFIDVTWGAGGSSNNQLSLDISQKAQKYFGLDVMMHLTCTQMPIEKINETLENVYTNGIENILALRGDPPKEQESWQKCANGFNYASELITHIRKKYGKFFGIGVAGYPEGHIESQDKQTCTKNLKLKVDSGADFIITQLFYDIHEYFDFVTRCREIGITCPIIPGILPITNYNRFRRFTEFSQTKVPDKINRDLENLKNDDSAVQKYGIELCIDMGKKLIENGVPGIHFYTLNLETAVTETLKGLGLIDDKTSNRTLPWRPSAIAKRKGEDVRPIFWSNRPKSYLVRTMNWDDFPNGRWGDARSPSFGNLNEYYLFRRGIGLDNLIETRLKMWGTPTCEHDIRDVFTKFCRGEINDLPWCEMPIQKETSQISEDLVRMNQNGLLTINSQPQINGAQSSDPEVGWGGPGGIVFQKAYIEFFVHKDKLKTLLDQMVNYPSLTYHAVNAEGEQFSKPKASAVNAVTWGVFPGKEIIQPTIVDGESFLIWKDEAFQLWGTEWAVLYPKDSKSHKIVTGMKDDYFLMNIVENNFVSGNIFDIFYGSGLMGKPSDKEQRMSGGSGTSTLASQPTM